MYSLITTSIDSLPAAILVGAVSGRSARSWLTAFLFAFFDFAAATIGDFASLQHAGSIVLVTAYCTFCAAVVIITYGLHRDSVRRYWSVLQLLVPIAFSFDNLAAIPQSTYERLIEAVLSGAFALCGWTIGLKIRQYFRAYLSPR